MWSRKQVSTGTKSSNRKGLQLRPFFSWLWIWGPFVLLAIAILVGGYAKYLDKSEFLQMLMADIIKAIGFLMVVLYVIYTRLLAIETKKMAVASMNIYSSQLGTVNLQLFQGLSSEGTLCKSVKDLTEKIHIEDKQMPEEAIKSAIANPNCDAIFVKIKNMTGRRIEVNQISYTVRHTGSDSCHENTIASVDDNTISQWGDKNILLLLCPEGEVEVQVKEIKYLDGKIVEVAEETDKFKVGRIRKPEEPE